MQKKTRKARTATGEATPEQREAGRSGGKASKEGKEDEEDEQGRSVRRQEVRTRRTGSIELLDTTRYGVSHVPFRWALYASAIQ